MNWKNMKIGTKLTLGFGMILILLILISGSFREIDHVGHEAVLNGQENEFLLEKEIDHLKWMAQLSDLFLKDEVTSLRVQTDDHKCGFGKWLYGEMAQKIVFENKELEVLMDSIKEPHKKLHESA